MNSAPKRRLRLSGMLLAVTAVALAGCGGRPLENLGDLSERVVYGDDRSTTTTAGLDAQGRPVLAVRLSLELEWYNIEIDDLSETTPSEIAADVWRRGDGINKFVQASPDEIAAALPDVHFPGIVPTDAVVATSQLVFDVETGTLDAAESAAFGVWSSEPYGRPREVAQLAILRVGSVPESEFPGVAATEETTGLSLEWTDGPYRYELFCRDFVEESICWEMAGTMRPLDLLSTFPSLETEGEPPTASPGG